MEYLCPALEAKLTHEFDAIADELVGFCEKLSNSRAATDEHLRLKAQALLCVLPDDNDPCVVLAGSLCEDIIANTSEKRAGNGDLPAR